MGQPAARQGDHITASDIHIVLVPYPPGQPVPNSLPHPFDGVLAENLSADVRIDGKAAATVGSSATNNPPHMPTPPGISFTMPPTNKGVIMAGSTSVRINGKAAARVGDQVQTCQEPAPNVSGQIVLSGPCTVLIGG